MQLTLSEASTQAQYRWRAILSSLWVYFLLNILFRDIHEFFRAGFLEQAITGTINGNIVTEENLFYGGLALQIPLLMTVLPRFSSDSMNRWLNVIGATFMLFSILAFTNDPDMDDVLFVFMESAALIAIAWFAWQGPQRVRSKQAASEQQITSTS